MSALYCRWENYHQHADSTILLAANADDVQQLVFNQIKYVNKHGSTTAAESKTKQR